jgi:hypothetical protein
MVSNQNSDYVYCNEHGRLIHRDNIKILEENNREHNISSAGYSRRNPEQNSILQAGLYDRQPTEYEQMETCLAFMEGRDPTCALPKRINRNVMQAGVRKRTPPSDIEMMMTLMEFGRFS